MKLVYYLCGAVVATTVCVIVWKWHSGKFVTKLPAATLEAIRDKLSESCRLLSEDNPSQAHAILEDVLQLDPTHPIALNNLAVLYARDGDFKKAESTFRRALKRADEVQVKNVGVFTVCDFREGLHFLAAYLPLDGDDSRLKRVLTGGDGFVAFHIGASFVKEIEGTTALKVLIQGDMKKIVGETDETQVQTDKAMRTALSQCGALVFGLVALGVWKWRAIKSRKQQIMSQTARPV